MTDQEINMAIAECCGKNPIPDGWMVYHPERKTLMLSSWLEEECKRWIKEHPQFASEGWVVRRQEHYPNYCEDLNAMHEAEKWLKSKDNPISSAVSPWITYKAILPEIVAGRKLWYNGTFVGDKWDIFDALCATARQRAEAFLRTLGKWKDS